MTATTPKADHTKLPPLASRFVDVAALPWEKGRHAGCETKTLVVDRSTGLLTLLIRMAPGAKLPDHEHMLIEQRNKYLNIIMQAMQQCMQSIMANFR